MKLETEVLIIGGGVTGAGTLRDLSLRGLSCLLVERRDIDAGASGSTLGLLHSGGRYAVTDPETAAECARESAILKRVAASCIEPTGGFFIALPGDDDAYIADFVPAARKAGVDARVVDVEEVLQQEPRLRREIIAAVRVPDAAINPFATTAANLEDAEARGARVLLNTRVVRMEREGDRVTRVLCLDSRTGQQIEVEPQHIVNAAGPWVDGIAAMAGAQLPILHSKGSSLVTSSRLTNSVINRLHPPSEGDFIVPGETVTITGTTSVRVEHPDHLLTSAEEVDLLVRRAARMLPMLARARFSRACAGVRPLVEHADQDDGGLSRGFVVFDHQRDGLSNLCSIAGGKLTTYRLMAERVSDLVCERLGVQERCSTHQRPLPGSEDGEHRSAANRLRRLTASAPEGQLVCECEMVGPDQVDALVERLTALGHTVDPGALRLRSRLGMGSCQGGLCGCRLTGHLCGKGELTDDEGHEMLARFLERRWPEIRPVLWGDQLRQEQLLEALYCGTLNLDGEL